MKNVLLYYSFSFALGGGEYLPLSFIAALQKKSHLTVAVDLACNFERSYEAFGAGLDIDQSKLKIVQVTPPDYNPKQHSARTSLYRFRRLKRLARSADVCISTACIIDFGRPAHHFINMIDFGDDAFTAFAAGDSVRGGILSRASRFISDEIIRPVLGMHSKRSIIKDVRQHIYPNSLFVERLMTAYYGPFNSTVFYPPTLFEARPGTAEVHDPLKVVYIGRILPAKRIEELVEIVEKARGLSGIDFTFHVAGRLDQSPAYGNKLKALAAERPWLRLCGALYGEEKERFLTSGSYALHAERDEAFGISVSEYLVSGLIPVIPDEGGTTEIVNTPDLTYRKSEDAARILARLPYDENFRDRMRRHCAERAKQFTRGAYLARQRELLDRIIGDGD